MHLADGIRKREKMFVNHFNISATSSITGVNKICCEPGWLSGLRVFSQLAFGLSTKGAEDCSCLHLWMGMS